MTRASRWRGGVVAGMVAAVLGGPAAAADPRRGSLIAHGGARPADPAACFRCHGLDGGGDGATASPRLAGLSAYYLAKQLRDFARGTRPDPVMTPIAQALSDRAREDVAAYYAGLPPPPLPQRVAVEAALAVGGAIARDGIPARQVPACLACHGLGGTNAAPAIPSLAGQHAGYLALQLARWRSGERHNDPLGGMTRFATALEPAEIEAVAAWFASRPAGGGR